MDGWGIHMLHSLALMVWCTLSFLLFAIASEALVWLGTIKRIVPSMETCTVPLPVTVLVVLESTVPSAESYYPPFFPPTFPPPNTSQPKCIKSPGWIKGEDVRHVVHSI